MLDGDLYDAQQIFDNVNRKYMLSILMMQADRAWTSKDYKDFIIQVENAGLDNLPESYQLKYLKAKKKL